MGKKIGKQISKHLFPLQLATLFLVSFSHAIAAEASTDTVAPEITLNGNSSITIEAGNHRYRDAGVTTTDNTKDAVSVSTLSDVDTTKAGVYTVSYVATDSSGNEAKATRSVEVTDTIAPDVSLNGDAKVVIKAGDNYSDAGVSVTDNSSGDIGITSNISINTNVAGEYTVDYTATDASGNKASISRKVVVAALDEKPPIITSDNSSSDNSSSDNSSSDNSSSDNSSSDNSSSDNSSSDDSSSVVLNDNRLESLGSSGVVNDSSPTTLNDSNSVAVESNSDSSGNLNTTTDQPAKGSGGNLSLYWSLLLGIVFLIRERKGLLRTQH